MMWHHEKKYQFTQGTNESQLEMKNKIRVVQIRAPFFIVFFSFFIYASLKKLYADHDQIYLCIQVLFQFWVRAKEEGLSMEMSALKLFTEANLHYQLSW